MAQPLKPGYGIPNREMLGRWLRLAPGEDGPFWALNLMKYREVASYGDGGAAVSGKAADDAYAPLGPLAAVGAVVALHGDVLRHYRGHPAWDRVGVVRYPSRAAFFVMQQRDDFRDKHVHKEAGMEFTIVMSCVPDSDCASPSDEGRLVLIVERDPLDAHGVDADGIGEKVASFNVEGVIIGDDRRFDRARFVRVHDDQEVAALVIAATGAAESHVLEVDRSIDKLVESLQPAPAGPATPGTRP